MRGALIGLVLLLAGLYALFQELNAPPSHSGHVYMFCGIIVLGALVIDPNHVGYAFRTVASVLPFTKKEKGE